MIVAGAIEPGVFVETGYVDYQRLPLPMSDGLPHPGIGGRRARIFHVDVAIGGIEFIRDRDGLGTLENLKRVRHVSGSRDAGQITLDLRIGGPAARVILLLLPERGGQVRDRTALDDSESRRFGDGRAKRDHRSRLTGTGSTLPVAVSRP